MSIIAGITRLTVARLSFDACSYSFDPVISTETPKNEMIRIHVSMTVSFSLYKRKPNSAISKGAMFVTSDT